MEYVSIRVSTLRGDQKIEFNTYIRINDKMVLYLRRGDSFEGDRLQRLKDKKLRKMYILTDEEQRYRNYLQQNIESAYDPKSNRDLQSRTEIIHGSQQSNVEEVFENPENEVSYGLAKDAAGKYADFILNNTNALGAIMKLENTDKDISHHGVSVATLALGLAQRMGIDDPKRLQLLVLGSLLHDYGHHQSPLVLTQPIASMSAADKAIWLQHPKHGASLVQDKKHFDQTVISIISQHEETIDGSGPLGLREKDQDPLTVLVSTANALDRLITFEGVPRLEAAKKLMIDKVGKHPLQQIQILGELLKKI